MEISDVNNLIQIYKYQMSFHSPQFIFSNFEEWKKSFIEDIDGEGRTLFKELFVKAIYEDALKLRKMLKEIKPNNRIYINYIGPIIDAHEGQGTLALFYKGKYRNA